MHEIVCGRHREAGGDGEHAGGWRRATVSSRLWQSCQGSLFAHRVEAHKSVSVCKHVRKSLWEKRRVAIPLISRSRPRWLRYLERGKRSRCSPGGRLCGTLWFAVDSLNQCINCCLLSSHMTRTIEAGGLRDCSRARGTEPSSAAGDRWSSSRNRGAQRTKCHGCLWDTPTSCKAVKRCDVDEVDAARSCANLSLLL